jgi:hypothetical protein
MKKARAATWLATISMSPDPKRMTTMRKSAKRMKKITTTVLATIAITMKWKNKTPVAETYA